MKMIDYNISFPIMSGPFWQMFSATINTQKGIILRWQNNKDGLLHLNFPLMKMLTQKSPYLSTIFDLYFSDSFIDVLITNNTGRHLDKIPENSELIFINQIYQGYSLYYPTKVKYNKDLLLENIFFANSSSSSISILDFGTQKRLFLEMKQKQKSQQTLLHYYRSEWDPRILKKNFLEEEDCWQYSLGIILFCLSCSFDCLQQIKQAVQIQINKSEKVIMNTVQELIIETCKKYKIKSTIVALIKSLINGNISWNQVLNQQAFKDDAVQPQKYFAKSEFQVNHRKLQCSVKNEIQLRSNSQPTLRLSELVNHRRNNSEEQLQKPKNEIYKKTNLTGSRQFFETQSESEYVLEQNPKKKISRHSKLQNFIADEIILSPQVKKEEFQNFISTEAERKTSFNARTEKEQVITPQKATVNQSEIYSYQLQQKQVNLKKKSVDQFENKKETIQFTDCKLKFQKQKSRSLIFNENSIKQINQEDSIAQMQVQKLETQSPCSQEIKNQHNQIVKSQQIHKEQSKLKENPKKIRLNRKISIENYCLDKVCNKELVNLQSPDEVMISPKEDINLQKDEKSDENNFLSSKVVQVIEFHLNIIEKNQIVELTQTEEDKMPMFTLIKSEKNIHNNDKIMNKSQNFNLEDSPQQSKFERLSHKKVSFFNLGEISPIRTNSPSPDVSFSSPLKTLKGILSKSNIFTEFQINHDIIVKKYNESIDAYGILGEVIVQLIKIFKALQNFWILPLFIFFKRMVQIRIDILEILINKQNIFKYEYFESLIESKEYIELINHTKTENQLILVEFEKLQKITLTKSKSLNESQKKKVIWFLNSDFTKEIWQTCNIYIWNQILPHFKSLQKNNQNQDEQLQFAKVEFMIQISIILLEQKQILIFDENQYDYDVVQDVLRSEDLEEILNYIAQNESTLNLYRQKYSEKSQKS